VAILLLEADMWTEPSPFVFDGPVIPGMLIGRDTEAQALRSWARAGRSAVVVAPRRYGKTSLLTRVQADAERLDRMPVILVDLYEVASASDFVIRLERAWARHTPDRLRGKVSRALAGTELGLNVLGTGFQMRLADQPRTDPLPALHALLDLPDRMHGHGGRTLIVFDEFQSIGSVAGAEGLIRTYVQAQRDSAAYVFCGSQPSMLARMFGDQARPFFGQAQRFELGRLDTGVLTDAICDIFAEAGRAGCEAPIAALMRVAEGHPQRAMLLAHLLWQRVFPGQAPAEDIAGLVVADGLTAVGAEIVAMFDVLPTTEKKTLRAVAEYGTPFSARALRDLNLAKGSAQSAATSLTERALIERVTERDVRWRIVDPLTALWLRTRYPTRPLPA
jgi:uncharacterized protein